MRSMNKFMKDIGAFSLVELQDHAGLARTCSNGTVRRFLNRMISVSINVEGRDS